MEFVCALAFVIPALPVGLVLCWLIVGPHRDCDPPDRIRGFLRVVYAAIGFAWGVGCAVYLFDRATGLMTVAVSVVGIVFGVLVGDATGRMIRPFIPGDEED
jgi:hypothetical protein